MSANAEEMDLKGTALFELRDVETGEVTERHEKNLVVDDGKNDVLKALGNLSGGGNAFPYLAVGDDGTSPASGDSSLVSEVERIALEDGNNEYSHDTAAVEISGTWKFGTSQANTTLREAGLFSASSGGVMFNRTLIDPAISKSSSEELTVTWTLSFV
jgi:hypothetical protein